MAESSEELRSNRHYDANDLPVLGADGKPERPTHDDDQQTLIRLHLHSEAVGVWRKLTETRFALLALVPGVSIVAWIQLMSADALNAGLGPVFGLLISAAGHYVVRSLRTYDRRNDELYDDAISRARRIESELGIDTGLFRGRPRPKVEGVNHSAPVETIYRISSWGWIVTGLWFVLQGLALVRDR